MKKTTTNILTVVLLASWILLTGCASTGLTTIPPRNYPDTKNFPIYVTTSDTVTLIRFDPDRPKFFQSKLDKTPIKEYLFFSDTLHIEFEQLTSLMPVSVIDKVEFQGINDPFVGPVSENELNIYRQNRRFLYGLLGGLVGNIAGYAIGSYLGDAVEESNPDIAPFVYMSSWLTGTAGGALLSYNIGYTLDNMYALDKIRLKRMETGK
ncbi:hypothetical protein K9N50_02340 [bacterium]|nr:hypothetical protein [bacterium]